METVRIETDARGVARLTLARSEKRNAMSAAMIGELTEAAAMLGGEASVRVVVLAADGHKLSKQNGATPLDLADDAAVLRALQAAGGVLGLPSMAAQDPAGWLAQAVDGRAKFWVTWRALQLRREQDAMLRRSTYLLLEVRGRHAAGTRPACGRALSRDGSFGSSRPPCTPNAGLEAPAVRRASRRSAPCSCALVARPWRAWPGMTTLHASNTPGHPRSPP